MRKRYRQRHLYHILYENATPRVMVTAVNVNDGQRWSFRAKYIKYFALNETLNENSLITKDSSESAKS